MTQKRSNTPLSTWTQVVLSVLLAKKEQEMKLSEIYQKVKKRGSKNVAANPKHWKAKVRQVLQRLRDQEKAENVSPGIWKAVMFSKRLRDKKKA